MKLKITSYAFKLVWVGELLEWLWEASFRKGELYFTKRMMENCSSRLPVLDGVGEYTRLLILLGLLILDWGLVLVDSWHLGLEILGFLRAWSILFIFFGLNSNFRNLRECWEGRLSVTSLVLLDWAKLGMNASLLRRRSSTRCGWGWELESLRQCCLRGSCTRLDHNFGWGSSLIFEVGFFLIARVLLANHGIIELSRFSLLNPRVLAWQVLYELILPVVFNIAELACIGSREREL